MKQNITKINKSFRSVIITTLISFLMIGCAYNKEIKDFESDGCSLFPDSSIVSRQDWCECCFEHDLAYWKGGTEAERKNADEDLRECVFKKTRDQNFAEIMYIGVRFGGSPYFYNWYRWGYGWDYDRKYEKLSDDEKKETNTKLKNYFLKIQNHPCN